MLAPHIKQKVDKLWDRFWSAGLTNPLVAVEQITYLLFIKRLEDIDKTRVDNQLPSIYDLTADEQAQIDATEGEEREALGKKFDASTCRWSYISHDKPKPIHFIEKVFPWLRGIEARLANNEVGSELASLDNRMADAYFQLDPNKGQVLTDAIDLIDQLFARAGTSAAQDIMGDTFEYLLSEMATAGKNGQFRTPRHLIRFMVELLDPEPGQRLIDPAAGTGGFLFSTQQYLMRKYTPPKTLRVEWDGTPHRTDGSEATTGQYAEIHNGAKFVGLDNDRTMARIGWMNLVLHDIDKPQLLQGDSLSKREGKAQLKNLLTSQSYDLILANPPFTGTVDTDDLEGDTVLFPRVGGKSKKKNDAVTNKSELLFLWLMLDLLDIGGRCAVIIPEGVLFGNTNAHRQLRQELLTEHVVEGVISLPGGVFQPYTGVKTSILIFRKVTRRDEKQTFTGQPPRSEHIWFYEIKTDSLTLNAKRDPLPGQDNDLWDAMVKFKAWIAEGRSGARRLEKTYFQPKYHKERWRQAQLRDSEDKLTPAGEAFSSLPDTGMWDGKVWGNHELFTDLPVKPKEAHLFIKEKASAVMHTLAIQHFTPMAKILWNKTLSLRISETISDEKLIEAWNKSAKTVETEFKRAARECENLFEKEYSESLPLWKEITKEALNATQADVYIISTLRSNQPPEALTHYDVNEQLLSTAREIAKLDGFDVTLRTLAIDQQTPLDSAKHWVVPVRSWAENEEWQSDDGSLKGSHDGDGLVRPQYVEAMLVEGLYDKQGKLKEHLLDPDCIEARDWNLSAGQYKPFDFTQLRSDKSVTELIGELRDTEQQIIEGLDTLLAMVEGRG